ncbi:MAG: hypothetical protein LAP85_26955 [Acidobacteriia bacterium]|nr:hypothetical protein [Terriglobia bacterium]
MKAIESYIQRLCVERVEFALQEAGAPEITIVVHAVGYDYEPNCFDMDYRSKSRGFVNPAGTQ